MTNLLMDYYTYPEQVHKLYDALCELYLSYLRARRRFPFDGFWTSDDLGHPKQMSSARKPSRVPQTPLRKDRRAASGTQHPLVAAQLRKQLRRPRRSGRRGLTVFHPVQKHTMDEKQVAGSSATG